MRKVFDIITIIAGAVFFGGFCILGAILYIKAVIDFLVS